MGVDVIQNCEVTGMLRSGGKITGVATKRGTIRAKKVAVVTSGHTSNIMEMAGVRMPVESVCLQALVSEPIKPVIEPSSMVSDVPSTARMPPKCIWRSTTEIILAAA